MTGQVLVTAGGTPAGTGDGSRRKARSGAFVRNSCLTHQEVLRPMKKALFILLAVLFAIGMAAAQQDILGPHNLNGHGCATCHAPHSGAKGNGGIDSSTGEEYLWGRDFVPATYYTFDGNIDAQGFSFTVIGGTQGSVSQFSGNNAPLFHTVACLSCHDGTGAPSGMTGTTFEANSDGTHAPTFLNDGTESLKNDHPVHVTYAPGGFNWPGSVDVNEIELFPAK